MVSQDPERYRGFSPSFLEIEAEVQRHRESDLASELRRLAINVS